MNDYSQSSTESGYSPFGVCLIVFIAILISNVFQFVSLVEQKNLLSSAKQNTMDTADKVKLAQIRLEGMAKDLLELAKTDENARKIVDEFNIQLIKNPTGAPAQPKAVPSMPAPTTPAAKK